MYSEQAAPTVDSTAGLEQHSEMLARVKVFNEDVDKLFAEYQQEIESDQPDECKQEFKDYVEVPRRELRRVLLRESLRAWLRV